jgi:hypothetical protein
MKKLLFFAASLAGLLFAASCQQEMLEPVSVSNTVTFTVETLGDIAAYRWEYSRDGITWYNTKMEGATTATLTVPVLLTRNGY